MRGRRRGLGSLGSALHGMHGFGRRRLLTFRRTVALTTTVLLGGLVGIFGQSPAGHAVLLCPTASVCGTVNPFSVTEGVSTGSIVVASFEDSGDGSSAPD